MQVEQLRTMNYEVAEALAPTWERRRGFVEGVSTPVREWMLRELAPQAGDAVLELAAGVGDTGFEAARLAGPGGRLISTDISPAMVDAARRRGQALGLANVEYRMIDAERIELADDAVDGVLCRFGYMLMPEPARALAETRRVLRPGGRLALAVWGRPESNPFFSLLGKLLVERGHLPPPEPDGPGIFSMASPERTQSLIAAAGFGRVRVEEVPVHVEFATIDEYLEITADTAGVLALALRDLGAAERDEIAGELSRAFAPFGTSSGYELPGVALCASGS